MSDTACMTGNEFLRRLKALAAQKKLVMRVDQKRGKGSHQTVYLGSAFTIIRNPKDELKTGTLHAMCKQLGINASEL